MKREYAPRAFLRHVPVTLLRDYFRRERLLLDLPLEQFTDQDTDLIFQAWDQLPEADRQRIEFSFRRVHEMATENGIRLLLEEAAINGTDLGPPLELWDGLHAKAFWAVLHAAEVFQTANLFQHTDHLSARFWKKRGGLPRKSPDVSRAALQRLQGALSTYFREHQGRGRNCTVESYVRAGRSYYFFAYPDDYTDTYVGHDHDTGRLIRRPQRPTFEVIFVFDPPEGCLSLYARGNKFLKADLQMTFCREILGQELPPEPSRSPYELNGLLRHDFAFATDPEDGISEVRVCRLRLSLRANTRRRFTLEGDPESGPADV
jgi:hypothetical protein